MEHNKYMDALQNPTIITPQQELYIDFVASGQMDFEGKKISYVDFALSINVDRSTLYNWQKVIPNFWDEVATRSDMFINRYVPKVINAMIAKSLKGDVSAAKLILNQAGRLKPLKKDEDTGFNPFGFDLNDFLPDKPKGESGGVPIF
jgi:hypothetical protein